MSASLAYVFWHRPSAGVLRAAYEMKLLAFQESLKAHPSNGLLEALSFREESPPWSKRRSAVYEDWYLVRDFRSLGALNDAAVASANRRPHDRVAREASWGAGGLYRQRLGGLGLRDARFATWIVKPARTPYQAFPDGLSKLGGKSGTDVWQRQMVFGPAPEFCVHSRSMLQLPVGLQSTTVRVRLVAKGGS